MQLQIQMKYKDKYKEEDRDKYKEEVKDKYKEEEDRTFCSLDFICWNATILVFTEHTKTLLNIQSMSICQGGSLDQDY